MSIRNVLRHFSTSKSDILAKVCIVGAGPAGFYAAQHILKLLPKTQVDVIERLPVPFGLVRYGVAPDHPEVKNVINTFTKTAQNPNFRFFGNVSLGTDVSLQQLKECYNAVLLSYGAEKDRVLNIPGEHLDHVLSARRFVGWYNGVPGDENLNPDLSGRSVAILGQGNVALDVARILLTPVDLLKSTDITSHALELLSKSKIEEVYIIGRRGPLQAAFTIKELREILKLPNCRTLWRPNDFQGIEEVITKLQRPRKRITELMISSLKAETGINISNKQFSPIFFKTPIDISKSSVKLATNILTGDDLIEKRTVQTNDVEFLLSDLIIRSIGYKSVCADADIPFDESRGVVTNTAGKVSPGLYTTGWLGTGPTGVILTTMSNAFATATMICEELISKDEKAKPGSECLMGILKNKNEPVISWKGWEKIDQYEIDEGKKLGKCREKLIDVKKMIEIGS